LTCALSVASSTAPYVVFPTAGVAFAATDEEKAGARALAEQAIQEAYPRGQYEQTIDLLRRAEALVHSPTHLLYIGMAQAKLGHLVLAQEAFLKASREPLTESSPEAFRVAVTTAHNELEALKPRLAKVTIHLTGVEASTATVTVDGSAVPSALVGVPMPVDPGERQFEAKAPGMLPASQRLVVTEGSSANIDLALTPDPNAPAVASANGETTTTWSTTDTGPTGDSSNTKQILLYTGIGSAVLGVGGLVGGYLMYAGGNDPREKADYLYGTCHVPSANQECNKAEQDQITAWDDEADNAQIPGRIIMGAGGVFLAAGATLIVLSVVTDDAAQQAGLNVNPWVSLNGAGVTGTF
jgi:hypothetical protein